MDGLARSDWIVWNAECEVQFCKDSGNDFLLLPTIYWPPPACCSLRNSGHHSLLCPIFKSHSRYTCSLVLPLPGRSSIMFSLRWRSSLLVVTVGFASLVFTFCTTVFAWIPYGLLWRASPVPSALLHGCLIIGGKQEREKPVGDYTGIMGLLVIVPCNRCVLSQVRSVVCPFSHCM